MFQCQTLGKEHQVEAYPQKAQCRSRHMEAHPPAMKMDRVRPFPGLWVEGDSLAPQKPSHTASPPQLT